MNADIEWVMGVIRAGPKLKRYGDPFNFVCTIIKENEKAFLMAASGTFTPETYRAIRKTLKEIGVINVRWDKKNNKPRSINKEA